MDWKKLFSLLILTLSVNYYSGQKLRVVYDLAYRTDSTDSHLDTKKMILDVNDKLTRFYPYKLYRSDSTLTANKKMGMETMSRSMDYDFSVIKDYTSGTLKKFYRIWLDVYELNEKLPKLSWVLSDETKTIDNIKCQKATVEYKGRQWEAWFSSEIPLNEGPYVFGGLPGLIISIYDTKGDYNFKMVEIKNDFEEIYTKDFDVKTFMVNQNQLKKVFIDYYNDPYREMKNGKIKLKTVDQNGNEVSINFNELTKQKQNQIKQFNNPIDLSDSITYP